MKKLDRIIDSVNKVVSVFLIANALYLGGFLFGANLIHRSFSSQIQTQSELEEILQEEKRRLGIKENIIIHGNLSFNNEDNSYAAKLGKREYEINLEPKTGHNLDVLRHELYHIADGHCEDGKKVADSLVNGLKYLYIYEPKAVLYSISGIKL